MSVKYTTSLQLIENHPLCTCSSQTDRARVPASHIARVYLTCDLKAASCVHMADAQWDRYVIILRPCTFACLIPQTKWEEQRKQNETDCKKALWANVCTYMWKRDRRHLGKIDDQMWVHYCLRESGSEWQSALICTAMCCADRHYVECYRS